LTDALGTWSALRGWVWSGLDTDDREGTGLSEATWPGWVDGDEAAADGERVSFAGYDGAGGVQDLERVQARPVAVRPDHREGHGAVDQPDAVVPAWARAAGECAARAR